MATSFQNQICIYETYGAVEPHCVDVNFSVKSLAFNGLGDRLAVGGSDGQLAAISREMSVAKMLLVVNRPQSPEPHDPISIESLAFSTDDQFVAIGGSDGEVDYANIQATQPEIITRFTGHSNAVFGLCSDQRSLVSASSDGTLRLWKISTPAELGLPVRTATGMQILACSADLTTVFSVARKNVYVYNPNSNTMNAVLLGPKGFMRSFTVSADGQILAGASEDEIVVWDLRPERLRQRACEIANRNLTDKEWKQYVSAEIPCRQVCPSIANPAACKD
jgi:WD40 repeat protein